MASAAPLSPKRLRPAISFAARAGHRHGNHMAQAHDVAHAGAGCGLARVSVARRGAFRGPQKPPFMFDRSQDEFRAREVVEETDKLGSGNVGARI